MGSILTFKHHINENINKANTGIGVVPRSALLFCKAPSRYGDVRHDQPENESFSSKTEKVQYKVSLAVTGTIRRTS